MGNPGGGGGGAGGGTTCPLAVKAKVTINKITSKCLFFILYPPRLKDELELINYWVKINF